ncbi:hypothetical protein RF11_01641 [Thelohanellus kitauei]|uniref:Uncharacterized protein n=1 Tax=Thelohanellus kitauei TaxID=669202 RepID=A0A0C2N8F3_THEKT|nr:hypothetical protein RF11_01641 [Thelohanellus kitauei]
MNALFNSLTRRTQNEGSANLYRDDENIKLYSKMIIALGFIPPQDVGSAFAELSKGRQDNLLNIYNYWEDNNFGRFRRYHFDNSMFMSECSAREDMCLIVCMN